LSSLGWLWQFARPQDEVSLETTLDAGDGGSVQVGEVDCSLNFEKVVVVRGEEGSASTEREYLDVGVGEEKLESEGNVDPLRRERLDEELLHSNCYY
jgi:hypothetical protein